MMKEAPKLLNDSLCFQLYVASKEIIRRYKPYLEEHQLTYTAFIAMIAIEDGMSVKSLGEQLALDSGTLSPLLKKLEKQGLIQRMRSQTDERVMLLKITPAGNRLKAELPGISATVYDSVADKIAGIDLTQLQQLLFALNQELKEKEPK